MNRSGPSLPMVKSPISLPRSFSIGVSTMRPCAGILFAMIRDRNASAPSPLTSYLA